MCLRCGDASCAAAQKGDYFRYEGGCTGEYSAADLAQALCYHCGQAGHLCCGTTPSEPPTLSCYNCGRSGHGGEQCPHDVRAHLHAERISDMKREREDLRQQEEAARDYSRGRAAPQYNSRDPPRRSATWGGHDYERASQQAGPRTEFSRHREAQEQGAGQDSWRGPGRRGPGDGRRPNSAGRINWDLESKPYRGGGGSSHYAGRPSSAQQHYGERGSSHRPAAPKFTPHAIPPAAFGTGGKNTDKGGGSGSAAGSPSAGKKRGGWQRDDDYPYDPSDMRADYSPSWRKAKTPRW